MNTTFLMFFQRLFSSRQNYDTIHIKAKMTNDKLNF